MAMTSLAHHIDMTLLHRSYQRTRRDGAPGIDGQRAEDYEVGLQANPKDLEERLKSGRYRAPAVRRVHIPKGDGKTRPIGIPTFEDKVLQRAVATVLEAVYEQDFLDCSHGFRPRRSAHQALESLWKGLMEMGGRDRHRRGCEVVLRQSGSRSGRTCRGAPHRHRVGPAVQGNGSFDFLGFTHLWAKARKGHWVVKRQTARTRQTRSLAAVAHWCQEHRHKSMRPQHAVLSRKLVGHFGYFGITGNSKSIASFRHEVIRSWRKWLDRRGQRRSMPWRRFARILERHPLTPARVVHSVYRSAASP